MAEKLDPRQVTTFEELLRTCLYEQEALRRVLVRKDLLTNEEVLEEIKAVRREMEGRRGRWQFFEGDDLGWIKFLGHYWAPPMVSTLSGSFVSSFRLQLV